MPWPKNSMGCSRNAVRILLNGGEPVPVGIQQPERLRGRIRLRLGFLHVLHGRVVRIPHAGRDQLGKRFGVWLPDQSVAVPVE